MVVKDLTVNKYVGIKQSKTPNYITQHIYRAKFLLEEPSVEFLAENIYNTVRFLDFDVIVPTNTTHSKVNFPERLCEYLSKFTEKPHIKSGLKNRNTEASPRLKGKKVLIVDDVVYSGRTMRKTIKAVKSIGPWAIYFIAVAKSK